MYFPALMYHLLDQSSTRSFLTVGQIEKGIAVSQISVSTTNRTMKSLTIAYCGTKEDKLYAVEKSPNGRMLAIHTHKPDKAAWLYIVDNELSKTVLSKQISHHVDWIRWPNSQNLWLHDFVLGTQIGTDNQGDKYVWRPPTTELRGLEGWREVKVGKKLKADKSSVVFAKRAAHILKSVGIERPTDWDGASGNITYHDVLESVIVQVDPGLTHIVAFGHLTQNQGKENNLFVLKTGDWKPIVLRSAFPKSIRLVSIVGRLVIVRTAPLLGNHYLEVFDDTGIRYGVVDGDFAL